MKIALLYAFWEGEKGWNSPTSIKNALERLGHLTEDFNLYHRGQRGQYSDESFRQFLARQDEFDFLLHMDYGAWTSPFLDQIGIPCVLECGDDPQSFQLNAPKAHFFDIILSPDKRCVEQYKLWQHDAFFWPHFCDPDIHVEIPDIKPDKFIVTSIDEGRGGKLENGTTLVQHLNEQFSEDVFLADRYYYGVDHSKFMNRGFCVLQKSAHGEITRRPFEAAACGRLVLLDKLDPSTGIEEIFVPNKDAIYYSSADELVNLIRGLKNDLDVVRRIAKSGQKMVLAHHTSDIRAKFIIDKVSPLIEEL